MTRKDYVKFAACVKRILAECPYPMYEEVIALVLMISDVLQADNRSFKQDQFLKACGL